MALIGWWPLNGTLEDNSINKNTLINSGASVALSGPLGKCYELIEASDKLTCGPNDTVSSWFNIKPFSVAAWVYFNSTDNANYGIFTIGTAATEQMLHIVKQNNRLYYGFYDDDCQSNLTFTANTWYHVVCTWDSVTRDKRIYINGILDTRTTSSGYLNVPENSQLYIGSYTGLSAPINGRICDVRVYNHVLSTKEIKELAKCKVLHYTFNQFQEPTTNILNYNTYYRCWSSNSSNACTLITDRSSHSYKMIGTCNVPGAYSYVYPYYSVPVGKYYTLSMKVKNNYSKTLKTCIVIRDGSNGDYLCTYTCFYIQPNTTETIFVTTDTLNQENKITPAIACYSDDITGEVNAEIYDVQLEQKDHPTPFTPSSRTGKVYDCSGYNNNADLTEDTTPKWVEGGPVGSGYYEFNGSNNITLPYKIFNDNINQRWTVCGWAYVEDNTIPNQYLNNFNLGNKLVHTSDGRGLLYINSGVNDAYTYTNGAVPTKNWFHIAYVLNTDIQRCDIYINGELNASSTNYTKTDVPYGFSTSTVFGTNLVGKLSDIRIYGTDLSSDDIRELYQARVSIGKNKNIYCNEIEETNINNISFNKTGLIKVNEVNSIGPTNELVLYMPLNGDTKDYSGSKYDGVNHGATVVQGLENKLAYEFDGVSLQYIDIPDTPKYEKFTLSAWVYNAPGGDERHSILRNFWEIVGTSLQYWSYDFSETYWRASPSGTVPYDTWTHIVTTWDGSKIRHYANGVLVYTQPEACTGTSQSFLSIGGYSGRDFKGKLQDLRIYNRALSPQEISWLYDMYNPNKNTGAKVFNNNIIYADSFKEGY